MTPPSGSRHALVCGGSRGIGKAITESMARTGMAVTILARDPEALEAQRAAVEELGASAAFAISCDLGAPSEAAAAVARHLAEHGPIDTLVHITGGPPRQPLLEVELDRLEAQAGAHLGSLHALARVLVPSMAEVGFGRIVAVTSMARRQLVPGLGLSSVLRVAVHGWIKAVARELPPGITANCVMPGFTETERVRQLMEAAASSTGGTAEAQERAWVSEIPEGRFATPAEIAEAVRWLCSPQAAYVRGAELLVDGGHTTSL